MIDKLKDISKLFKGDVYIWVILGVLSIMSILVVYSATGALAYKVKGGNTFYFLWKHIMLLVFGFGMLLPFYFLNFKKYSKLGVTLWVISLILLVFTLFYGVTINNASRWIELPYLGLTFQTSDLAKIALILYVSREISRLQDNIKAKQSFIWILLPIVVTCGLIAISDFSTAALLFLTTFILMWVGRMRFVHLFGVVLAFGAVIGGIFLLSHFIPDALRVQTWSNRVTEFVNNPDGQDQVQLAKIAISNGGFTGNGPGESFYKNHLPHPYSDFAFAFIIEEYGIVGGIMLCGTYILLFVRVLRLVTRSSSIFNALVALGLGLLIVIQAMLNMAVSAHLVPVTGLPLPIVSYGGTSLVFSFISFGIILCVSKYVDKKDVVNV